MSRILAHGAVVYLLSPVHTRNARVHIAPLRKVPGRYFRRWRCWD